VNGSQGKRAVEEILQETAAQLKVKEQEILIAQTGLIGAPFPVNRFKRAIPQLIHRLKNDGGHSAAKGIMTTDRAVKEVALSADFDGARVTIGAIAKGAGMVHPDMATMLAFITSDVAITKPLLKRALRYAVDDTFNCMAIDNDRSTNDTVFVLANGQAGNAQIHKVDTTYRLFREGLKQVCRSLACKMVADGEGVSHVCTLRISGAKNPTQAEKIARQIANSMLFKTMLAGADPNWGRIVACIGASGADYQMDSLNISFDGVEVLHHGRLKALHLPKAAKMLQKKSYTIDIVVGKGRGKAEFLTSDLTTKYVLINASYS
jgi:glutamate N-acetyltransferase/amino-acid N-acetyltransferase